MESVEARLAALGVNVIPAPAAELIPTVRGVWYSTDDAGWFDPSFVLSDDERIAGLQRLSEAATPGPWIRKWESTEVHYMGGNDALTSMQDIDFAVAACAFVRDMLEEAEDRR